jgi:hypothetical protein
MVKLFYDSPMGQRRLGTWVIRPGMPTIIGMPKAGPLTLLWKRADGTPESRNLVVIRPTPIAL